MGIMVSKPHLRASSLTQKRYPGHWAQVPMPVPKDSRKLAAHGRGQAVT